ncbi:MAG: glycosyltransferase [Bacteroidota bacterium]
MTLPAILLGVACVYYLFFVGRVIVGLRRLRHRPTSDAQPTVTVVIAARNEKKNIGDCIDSVIGQDYPADRLQVIVVDDDSEDGTLNVMNAIATVNPRVRVLTLPPRAADGIGRKPEAVRLAVEQSSSECIVTTDADCTHHPKWIQTMMASFVSTTALVAGPVVFSDSDEGFSRVERLDFLGLVVSGAGLIGAGRPIICNGANLAYRKSIFLRALDRVQHSSNDDGTLMSRIVTGGLGTVGFAHAPEAVVRTCGQGNFRSFFQQRGRWAAVRGRFLDPFIYAELAALFLFFIGLIAATVTALVSPGWRLPVAGIWFIKALVDGAALSMGARAWNVDMRWRDFLAAELFHPVSIVAATLLSFTTPFSWKGRRLKR